MTTIFTYGRLGGTPVERMTKRTYFQVPSGASSLTGDPAAVDRVRAIVQRSRLDRITADLLWSAVTSDELRHVIEAHIVVSDLKAMLLRACGEGTTV